MSERIQTSSTQFEFQTYKDWILKNNNVLCESYSWECDTVRKDNLWDTVRKDYLRDTVRKDNLWDTVRKDYLWDTVRKDYLWGVLAGAEDPDDEGVRRPRGLVHIRQLEDGRPRVTHVFLNSTQPCPSALYPLYIISAACLSVWFLKVLFTEKGLEG